MVDNDENFQHFYDRTKFNFADVCLDIAHAKCAIFRFLTYLVYKKTISSFLSYLLLKKRSS